MIKTILTACDICVLIPCYNNAAGLRASVQRIDYIPAKMVVVIVDDGSELPVEASGFADTPFATDIVRLDRNQGITHALNAGLRHIHAHYKPAFIARLDCGDICHPERFYRQVDFLHKHPDVLLLGSWCRFFDPVKGSGYCYTTPIEHDALVKEMHLRNCFIHPTAMWRNVPQVPSRYPTTFPAAEDYAFFFEIMRQGKTAVLDDYLVTCEISKAGISIGNRQTQLNSRMAVIQHYHVRKNWMRRGKWKLRLMKRLPYSIIGHLKVWLSVLKPARTGAVHAF
ncbi:MAG: glycosyltransferase [Bacteroidota bacterium]|nr:glycosyltransferase [Bacteroidota bacterium]